MKVLIIGGGASGLMAALTALLRATAAATLPTATYRLKTITARTPIFANARSCASIRNGRCNFSAVSDS